MVLTLSSRAHSPPLPSDATVMLIPNMHQDPLLMPKQRPSRLDDDDDLSDEPDPVLLESNFLEFFNETHDEFQSIGKVVQFKVCKNMTPHLRGNVYVQYATPEETAAAIQIFNGRFFAGMRLSCMAVPVPSWKAAICGTRQCPKGDLCNFLHTDCMLTLTAILRNILAPTVVTKEKMDGTTEMDTMIQREIQEIQKIIPEIREIRGDTPDEIQEITISITLKIPEMREAEIREMSKEIQEILAEIQKKEMREIYGELMQEIQKIGK
ncbi:U2 small nuclear ribonucleoprotein auxiliary factor 35 kDa subunit- protein 2 [Physocladia obscura]|uniref:U2 small nuclear ribonucleoprotein auxiliary factor 35 kDa subunit- protein 2 n=1 Tax=Physocladia obscura TaxID=109957 RepID=A0AAD5T578_9FUNG|nr:U2 small nuclear ribonucleoprotein auxiliary factor 35 kDa subunit- protein 2 [Physocladia obscura]